MKTLFIYYSHSGNGDVVAEYLRERGVEIRKVDPKKTLPKSFFGAIMKGGFLATIGYKAQLIEYDKSVEGYDHVIIGSPVWNGRFSCPINALLAELDLRDTRISFLLYAGGGTAPKAVKRISVEYPSANVVVMKEPKKCPDELEKAEILLRL